MSFPGRQTPSPERVAWTGVFAPAVLALAALALAPQAAHHDDDLTHFLVAAWSWIDWRNLLDEWGRPGFTIPWALPSRFGWPVAKAFTVGVATVTALLLWSAARKWQLPAAHWTPWVFWLQPLVFRLSHSTLTEPATALYVAGALCLLAHGRPALSAVVFSLTAITRHEMLAFLPMWSLAMWQGWRHALPWVLRSSLLLWAPLAVNIACAMANVDVPLALLLNPADNTDYGVGQPLAFVAGALLAWGTPVTALALAGAQTSIRNAGPLRLCAGLWMAFLLLHTVLRAFGLFASGGYPRFLCAVSPALALGAAAGIPWALKHPRQFGRIVVICATILLAGFVAESLAGTLDVGTLHPVKTEILRWGATLPAILAIGIGWMMGGKTPVSIKRGGRFLAARNMLVAALLLPIATQMWPVDEPHATQAAGVVDWLRRARLHPGPHASSSQPGPRLLTTDPWIAHFARQPQDRLRTIRQNLERLYPGDIVVWDRQHGPAHGANLDEAAIFAAGFEFLARMGHSPLFDEPLYTVFRKAGDGASDIDPGGGGMIIP